MAVRAIGRVARAQALAARASGGLVLVQVERIANGPLPTRAVVIPGALVDHVRGPPRSTDSAPLRGLLHACTEQHGARTSFRRARGCTPVLARRTEPRARAHMWCWPPAGLALAQPHWQRARAGGAGAARAAPADDAWPDLLPVADRGGRQADRGVGGAAAGRAAAHRGAPRAAGHPRRAARPAGYRLPGHRPARGAPPGARRAAWACARRARLRPWPGHARGSRCGTERLPPRRGPSMRAGFRRFVACPSRYAPAAPVERAARSLTARTRSRRHDGAAPRQGVAAAIAEEPGLHAPAARAALAIEAGALGGAGAPAGRDRAGSGLTLFGAAQCAAAHLPAASMMDLLQGGADLAVLGMLQARPARGGPGAAPRLPAPRTGGGAATPSAPLPCARWRDHSRPHSGGGLPV